MSTEKKECIACGKSKPISNFYKTNNPVTFPDERYHTCNVCTRNSVGEENGVKLALFLQEINRPFLSDVWEKSLEKKGHTLGEYLRTISSTPAYMNLSYQDSDVKIELGKHSLQETRPHVYDKNDVIIVLDERLMQKWQNQKDEITPQEVLELEKYYRNMKYDYDIETTAQESMLEELAVLNMTKTQLLKEEKYSDHKRVSDAFNSVMQNAGFRPIDKKNNLEKTGIDSVGEIVAQIERDGGFIPPNRVNYNPDDIDKMLTYYVQWAQRFNNEQVSTEVIKEWRDIDEAEINFTVNPTANQDYKDDEIDGESEE